MSKQIVFLLGDPEYRSHVTMPPFAAELAERYGFRTTVSISTVIPDRPDFKESEFPGIEALADADLAVFFTRFRVLPAAQMEAIGAYLVSGRPVVGLRTATHSFKFPDDSPYHSWNDGFGREVLGTPWISHHGGQSTTHVTKIPEVADHPILRSLPDSFDVRSWLYIVLPLTASCRPLLWGVPVGSQREDSRENPVAWTNTHNGGRVFYTSLGHPDEFELPAFRQLLANGILWAMGEEPD